VGNYCNWADVYAHLDKQAYQDPDIARMEAEITDAETRFDGALRFRYDMPFSESVNPEAFGMAQIVVSKRAASQYIRWDAQVQGKTTNLWFADQLVKDADELQKMFTLRQMPATEPTDADDPVSYVPVEAAVVNGSEPTALFKRANITGGSTSHW
jgi:hypothetical protein